MKITLYAEVEKPIPGLEYNGKITLTLAENGTAKKVTFRMTDPFGRNCCLQLLDGVTNQTLLSLQGEASLLALLAGHPSLEQALVCLINEPIIQAIGLIESQYHLNSRVKGRYDLAGEALLQSDASLTLSAQSAGEWEGPSGSNHE